MRYRYLIRSVLRRRPTPLFLIVLCTLLIIGGKVFYFVSFTPKVEYSQRYVEYISYKQQEPSRQGPGEQGAAVLLSESEAKLADSLFKAEAFNRIASDKVSLERSVKDVRDARCKAVVYPKFLPRASVVIIFHNEAWSTLLRTVHSVVNRSPPDLLQEVVLLDDFSDKDFLKKKLETYILEKWPDGLVRLVRTPQRSGLIRARIAGAEAAVGDVLIFLDSHCEVNTGWIEPLLSRISEDRRNVVCPIIDAIDDKTLEYSSNGGYQVGGFTWSLHFTWQDGPPRPVQSSDYIFPIKSPTMAGGLFAVDRKFFFEIGSYDAGMDVWGGENLEISFRVWMCGGRLEFVPCSRVGHIFRSSHPYTFPGNKDTHGINSARLADVWMDDYKRLFFAHRKALQSYDFGDVSDRKKLRAKLQCHSFKWYLDNVYPEKFIPDENVKAWGMVRNPVSGLCLDTLQKDESTAFNMGMFECQSGGSASQVLSLSHTNHLRREEACLSVSEDERHVLLKPCSESPFMKWKYDTTKNWLINEGSNKCLDTDRGKSGDPVVVSQCRELDSQNWLIEHVLDL